MAPTNGGSETSGTAGMGRARQRGSTRARGGPGLGGGPGVGAQQRVVHTSAKKKKKQNQLIFDVFNNKILLMFTTKSGLARVAQLGCSAGYKCLRFAGFTLLPQSSVRNMVRCLKTDANCETQPIHPSQNLLWCKQAAPTFQNHPFLAPSRALKGGTLVAVSPTVGP